MPRRAVQGKRLLFEFLDYANGYTTGFGGGLVNNGALSISNCTPSNNFAQFDIVSAIAVKTGVRDAIAATLLY